ncbi:MAG TPA: hypothetical protein VEJ23_01415, partial [Solirubrobacteraceae bacterium]|nr:hypothetical protein [Solirubrobacteraceae bacterium]
MELSLKRGRRFARMTGVGVLLTAGILTTAGSAAAKPPPPPPQPTCGETVTTNVTLNTNLKCPENGLIVGANGITINLRGHTITGTGPSSGQYTGIDIDKQTGVTIKNGTVTGFYIGIGDFFEAGPLVASASPATSGTLPAPGVILPAPGVATPGLQAGPAIGAPAISPAHRPGGGGGGQGITIQGVTADLNQDAGILLETDPGTTIEGCTADEEFIG